VILISGIDFIHTAMDFHQISHLVGATDPDDFIQFENNQVKSNVVSEIIHGRRFIDRKSGEDVVIGVTERVGKLLGITMECFDNLEKDLLRTKCQLSKCLKENNRHEELLERFANLSVFGRFLFFVNGRLPS